MWTYSCTFYPKRSPKAHLALPIILLSLATVGQTSPLVQHVYPAHRSDSHRSARMTQCHSRQRGRRHQHRLACRAMHQHGPFHLLLLLRDSCPPSLQFEDFITVICQGQKHGRGSQSALRCLVWTVLKESKHLQPSSSHLELFFFWSMTLTPLSSFIITSVWEKGFPFWNILQYFKEKMRQRPFNFTIQWNLSTVGIFIFFYCTDQLLLSFTYILKVQMQYFIVNKTELLDYTPLGCVLLPEICLFRS